VNAVGNITFGSFIAEKRKAHKFNLRDTAKHLNIAYGYLCDIEQSRRPAPNGDFVERISAFLNLDKSEHELLLDLAAKSRNTVSADLPDYIMEKDIVRAALRVAKEVDATDEEWQTFNSRIRSNFVSIMVSIGTGHGCPDSREGSYSIRIFRPTASIASVRILRSCTPVLEMLLLITEMFLPTKVMA